MVPAPPAAKRDRGYSRTGNRSDGRRLLAAHALGLVALDVVAVGLDLALRAVLAPAEVFHGYPRRRLVHVESHARPHPDHRTPEHDVGEGLGQLAAEGVEHLGTYDAALDGGGGTEGHPQRRVVTGHLEHLRRPGAVELQESLGELVREVARGLEGGGERPEVLPLPARERHLRRAALGRLAAELVVDHVHRLAREIAVGRQFAPDYRDQALHPRNALPDGAPLGPDALAFRVVVDYVAPRDRALGALGLEGERADAGVGEEHALARQVRLGDDVVRLLYEVLDLLVVRHDAVEVALVADVRGPDQVAPVPRHYEVWPPVLARLDVEGLVLGRAGEWVHDQVAPLGAPDHARPALPEYLVPPGARHVDRHGGARRVGLAAEDVGELDARHPVALAKQPVHLRVGQHDRAVLVGRDRVLDGYPLGVLDLGVVVEGRAEQALRVEARLALQGLLGAQHAVVVQTLVQRERVVAQHAETDHERAVLGALVHRDEETKGPHEMR